jgi:hypothetical protein
MRSLVENFSMVDFLQIVAILMILAALVIPHFAKSGGRVAPAQLPAATSVAPPTR